MYGVPRATNDWDLNVFCPEERAPEVFSAVAQLGVVVDSHSLAEVEKKGQVRLSWGDKKVDLFFAYAPFHRAVEARIREADFDGVRIWVLSVEDIIVFKVIFNRPHDWRDIERMCHRMGSATIDQGYLYHWLGEILGDDDGRVSRLRDTIAAADALMSD